jgi:hypothetical protein
VLLIPLLAAACGSSSATTTTGGTNSTSTTTSAPTSTATSTVASPSIQQFVATANAVCMRSDRRISRVGRLTRNPAGWAKEAAAARLAMREMRAITPPPSRAAAFQRMLKYGAELTRAIESVHAELAKKHFNEAAFIVQDVAARLLAHVQSEAKTAGLTFCQQSLTDWPA